jgi:hypothetical protein
MCMPPKMLSSAASSFFVLQPPPTTLKIPHFFPFYIADNDAHLAPSFLPFSALPLLTSEKTTVTDDTLKFLLLPFH